MPDLESFLAQWRASLPAAPHLPPETLDELEGHLRERIEQLIASGVPEAEACQRAATELGNSETIATEFRKLDASSWLPVKIVTGVAIVLALGLAVLLLTRPFPRPNAGLLLAIHVFTITIGYATTLLLGVLGICFVLQRARTGFSRRQLASLSRVTFIFATVSTVSTAIGIVLAMLWAQREWGRLWGWDGKEIGALCVFVWLAGFLIAHAFRWVTARGLLIASLLGNNVVLLGWFAPSLSGGLHAYGFQKTAWLLLLAGAMVLNVVVMLIGLAPSGCLRARKE